MPPYGSAAKEIATMDKELAAKLEAFQKQACADGENVVFRIFPAKILELQDKIKSAALPGSPYHHSQTSTTTDATVYPAPESSQTIGEPQSKKRKMDDGSQVSATTNDTQHARLPSIVHANKHMSALHATLKRECEELVSLTDQVKLWISLTMPKPKRTSRGDNFGVQIQEEVIAELQRSQDSAFNLRDGARNDYLARAKICSKLIKYPNVEDYTLALQEHDDHQFYLARQHLNDLRNIYAVLTDLIHKNIAKIRAPRGNNGVALY
ncbi:Proteasome activator pa28 REG alpha/beta subunit [Mycena sanguinolenta]|uniref:Proteasome activator pa28 REG alpha/beta subunit n=1 Tax=Mycena sanguinolenta TaxID=230812 RepID=A0A8H6XDC5_9AGAR|nr:Proteasome activator pa28 REG alpha/beta subunit [Mycena sanguinolenta]